LLPRPLIHRASRFLPSWYSTHLFKSQLKLCGNIGALDAHWSTNFSYTPPFPYPFFLPVFFYSLLYENILAIFKFHRMVCFDEHNCVSLRNTVNKPSHLNLFCGLYINSNDTPALPTPALTYVPSVVCFLISCPTHCLVSHLISSHVNPTHHPVSHLVSSQLITSLEMEGALLKGRSDRSVYFLEKVCVCVSVLRVRRLFCVLKVQCVFVCVCVLRIGQSYSRASYQK
jgi:hypothetical protein